MAIAFGPFWDSRAVAAVILESPTIDAGIGCGVGCIYEECGFRDSDSILCWSEVAVYRLCHSMCDDRTMQFLRERLES